MSSLTVFRSIKTFNNVRAASSTLVTGMNASILGKATWSDALSRMTDARIQDASHGSEPSLIEPRRSNDYGFL
jgi:hypothetical protein